MRLPTFLWTISYPELGYDIRPLTHTQYKAYEELMSSYADLPKTLVLWEKKKEQEI